MCLLSFVYIDISFSSIFCRVLHVSYFPLVAVTFGGSRLDGAKHEPMCSSNVWGNRDGCIRGTFEVWDEMSLIGLL